MTSLVKSNLLFFVALITTGCASTPELGMDDYDENSSAAGAAYVVDAMSARRPMPSRPDWKPLEFYFKHCTSIDSKVHYSKTSYECTGPH